MSELIRIDENNKVDGRELHDFLQVGTAYKDWFPRMVEYGFVEGVDFNPLRIEQVRQEGGRKVCREILTHVLTIATATRRRTSTKKGCASFPKKRQQPEIQTGRGIVQ